MDTKKAAAAPLAGAFRRWPGLLTVPQLPPWMRDNDYIVGAYRPPLASTWASIVSALFYLHNETVNVWTHFLGFLYFLRAIFHCLPPSTMPLLASLARSSCTASDPGTPVLGPVVARDFNTLHLHGLAGMHAAAPSAEALTQLKAEHAKILIPLLLSACVCLFLSALYHAVYVRGPRVSALLAKLDFCGIALLIAGHAMSGIRMAFYCADYLPSGAFGLGGISRPRGDISYNVYPYPIQTFLSAATMLTPVRVYSILTCIAATVVARAILTPGFGGKKVRAARAWTFSGLTLVGVFPLVHSGILHGWTHPEYVDMVSWLGLSVFVYFWAAVFYASRVPECCRPGEHDIWCASHQIMHILVVGGVYVHYIGILRALEYHTQVGCSLSPLNSAPLRS